MSLASVPVVTCRDAINRYWPADTRQNALSVAYLESGLRADAHLYSDVTGDDSWSCFEINRYGTLASARPSAAWLSNPSNNTLYALGMYKSQSWTPWLNSAHKLGLLK
jgi:hypothetical protein